MCGIAGVVASPGGPAPDPADVHRACEAIRHRGPDHGAVEAYGRCALGYRRLSVIDLVTGDQPVADERERVHAVLNGQLYSFRTLREELAARGHAVPGTGDTPVIPHLYEEHGERFPEHLDGMFAIALWDAGRERLVLARDRFGKKPLLWTRRADGSLAFASELKALLALGGVDLTVSPAAVDAYLALGYVPGDRTVLEAVRRVPPGHRLVWEHGEPVVEPYWRLRPAEFRLADEEWIAEIRRGVVDAVRARLVSDVPLGALLSGGIDSSVVVAAMAETAGGRLRTFSVGFADARYDERVHARRVAERFGTDHEEIVVEPDAAELLPRLASSFDEPFADSSALPTFLVCEHARRFVTVALTGDGGDEVFGGYERYRAHALAERFARLPAVLPRTAARAARALFPSARREPRSQAFRAARLLETFGLSAGERYGRLMEIFPPGLRAALTGREPAAVPTAGVLLGEPRAAGPQGLQLLDLETYLPGDLLVKADIASMANSLELRSPLLDHRLVERALALPAHLRIDGGQGKVALRRAFADVLPPEIVARGKKGFGVPVSRWFRGELRGLAGDVLLDGTATERGLLRRDAVERLLAEHVAGRRDHGPRLWSLVMLELWFRHTLAPAAAGERAAIPSALP